MMVIFLFVTVVIIVTIYNVFGNTGSKEGVHVNEHEPEIKELQYFCIKDSGYYVSVWPKNRKLGDHLPFNIAGIMYRKNMKNYIGEYKGMLVAEPDNEYDKNAIKVLADDGKHVGYVPKDMISSIRDVATLPCPCYIYIGTYKNAEGTHYYSCCYITI